LAAKKTGHPEEALKDLLKLIGKRKEWFIQHEIAELYLELGEPEATLKYALESALNHGDLDKKGKVLTLLYNLLNAQGHTQEALDHIKLKNKVALESGHRPNPGEIQMLQSQGVVVEQLPPAKTLEKNLRTFWIKLLDDFKPTLKGTINKILDTGQAGFISKNKKEFYYFQIKSFRGDKKLCVVGQQVSFQLEEGFDKKKNQPTQNAVNVRPLEKPVNNPGPSNQAPGN
jgi:tetratricopeptide (TPR) repeat protein